jgi:hypothetical protein
MVADHGRIIPSPPTLFPMPWQGRQLTLLRGISTLLDFEHEAASLSKKWLKE